MTKATLLVQGVAQIQQGARGEGEDEGFPFCGPLFLSPFGHKQVVLLECLVVSECLIGCTLFELFTGHSSVSGM